MKQSRGGSVPLILLALIVVAFALAGWNRRWVSEDAFIALRVVDNILDGHGPVYNVGERIEAGTSPAWIFLLTLAALPLRSIDLEWIAVAMSLVMSVAGLFLGSLASLQLLHPRRGGVLIPIGAIVVAAVPVFWDFATSGLETGLTFLWLGVSLWGLKAMILQTSTQIPPSIWVPVWVGLGPLIRPDLLIFSVFYFAAVIALSRPRDKAVYLRVSALTWAIPFIYQVFRMGYFANLVPNPALAREAGLPNWERGFIYFRDYFGAYWLLVPLLAIAISLGAALVRWGKVEARDRSLVVGAVLGASLLHMAFIVRVGGDFMHGRLLLPATFAIALLGWVSVRAWPSLLLAFVVVDWGAFAATRLRVPYVNGVGTAQIEDERGAMAFLSHPYPVTLADYRRHDWVKAGNEAREIAGKGGRGIFAHRANQLIPVGNPKMRPPVVVMSFSIGMLGYAAADQVWIADRFGLADPIAGRMLLTNRDRRPGHEKNMSSAWVVARYGIPGSEQSIPEPAPESVSAARSALACGAIRDLLRAVEEPMSPKRFARNLLDSARFYRLRIPADAREAEREFCKTREH